MTGERNHRWDCQKKGCYVQQSMPDFTWLNNCWPPRVRPSDIDMCVELRGRFLVVEWKPAGFEWDVRAEGQRKTLARMARLDPFDVWCIRGDRGALEMRDMGIANDPWRRESDEGVQLLCKHWSEGALSTHRGDGIH